MKRRGRASQASETDACRISFISRVAPGILHRMPSIDMPLEQMRQYKPTLYREANFQEFWESTAREAVD